MALQSIALSCALLVQAIAAAPATGLFIPPELTYLLPQPYFGPQPSGGNLSTNWLSTTTHNQTINELFAEAKNVTYYAFDPEFYTILGGKTPEIEEVESGGDYYYEGGEWLYDRNEVWMASLIPLMLSSYNLKTRKFTHLDIPALYTENPAGLYYYGGLVYVSCAGNDSVADGAPGIYTVDPSTLEVTPILNNFFGLRTLIADDVTVVPPNTTAGATSCTHAGEINIFYTSFSLAAQGLSEFDLPETMPDAVWRFSPQTQSLQGAISRSDILSPNGIRVDRTGRYLFVTDTDAPQEKGNAPSGGGAKSSGSSAIFRFDLDEDCMPYNKKMIDMVRSYADGMHIDNYGRIWTAEYDGIVVRNPRGKVIGVFNAYKLQDGKTPPMANFVLAGDKLVILAVDRMYVMQLGQNVTNEYN